MWSNEGFPVEVSSCPLCSDVLVPGILVCCEPGLRKLDILQGNLKKIFSNFLILEKYKKCCHEKVAFRAIQ
jgi:hypothetical protein